MKFIRTCATLFIVPLTIGLGCKNSDEDSYKAPPPSANARPADVPPIGAASEGPKQSMPNGSQGAGVKPL